MINDNKEIFDNFLQLHQSYSINQEDLQERFNQEGGEVLKIIKEWENKLCSQSEKAGYGSFTSNLSEKFWAEVRKMLPLIDYIGIIAKKEPQFSIKKINLSKV